MNGTRGLKVIVVDEELSRLVVAVLDKRQVPLAERPVVIERIRASDDWRTVCEQRNCGASDRALLQLIERAMGHGR